MPYEGCVHKILKDLSVQTRFADTMYRKGHNILILIGLSLASASIIIHHLKHLACHYHPKPWLSCLQRGWVDIS